MPTPRTSPCSDHLCYLGDAKWCQECSDELRDKCRSCKSQAGKTVVSIANAEHTP